MGVHVRDLLLDKPLFLTDVGFSHTTPLGMVLAARVMAPDGITMTTGAALPVGVLSAAERLRFLQDVTKLGPNADFRPLSAEQASEMAASVIRTCLQAGAAEHIEYIEPRVGRGPGREQAGLPPARPVGRNAPCPCGSGRKFRKCCGRRR
jgi:hypothetical protein